MGEALRLDRTSTTTSRARRARRRVFIRDARNNGHYLRATWHPEGRMFVVSTWRDEVCTGAVRLPVEASGDLASLIIDGLSESLVDPARSAPAPRRLAKLESQLRAWARRARGVTVSRMRTPKATN
jgi:hypothetical protein